ncbi:MAG: HU family DNA-binding protein [Nitrospirota bacterium]|nr:MAG: HU family DNA-binding protein [Nitrospirota bacterium]
MNKGELIDKVSTSTGTSKADATRSVNAVLDTISKALKKGDSVTLVGFGTFSVTKTKARNGRNPQTGETIKINARKVPKFKAGQGLKDLVSGK